jgi:hypothetical protein
MACYGIRIDRTEFYMAAGHSCWGILMGPASGESMASLIGTGKSNRWISYRSTLSLCNIKTSIKYFNLLSSLAELAALARVICYECRPMTAKIGVPCYKF